MHQDQWTIDIAEDSNWGEWETGSNDWVVWSEIEWKWLDGDR